MRPKCFYSDIFSRYLTGHLWDRSISFDIVIFQLHSDLHLTNSFGFLCSFETFLFCLISFKLKMAKKKPPFTEFFHNDDKQKRTVWKEMERKEALENKSASFLFNSMQCTVYIHIMIRFFLINEPRKLQHSSKDEKTRSKSHCPYF